MKWLYGLLLTLFILIFAALGLSYINNNFLLDGKTIDTRYIPLSEHYEMKIRHTAQKDYYSIVTTDHEFETLIHEKIIKFTETSKGYYIMNQEDFFNWFTHDNYFFVPKNKTMIEMYDTQKELEKAHGKIKLHDAGEFARHHQQKKSAS